MFIIEYTSAFTRDSLDAADLSCNSLSIVYLCFALAMIPGQ